MDKKKAGRPVDLYGINISEIENWMNSNNISRKVLICQSIISLNNGASMSNVCEVFGVTRETVRLWKERFREAGLQGVLRVQKVEKRSKLSIEKEDELKSIVKASPKKQGYKTKKWTGVLIQKVVLKKWKYKICMKTAQVWLAKVR